MTRFLAYNRHFLVMAVVFAMIAATLLVRASVTSAIHLNCSGESAIEDAGAYYIVHGTKGVTGVADDVIDCTASDKAVEIRGNSGDDTLTGSVYADWLLGGWGNDTLNGGDGADKLYGGWDADTLNGGAGNDWLEGGQNVDALNGGTETDTCLGGPATDTTDGTCDPFTQ